MNNKLKALVAASTLAVAAGSANAALYTVDVIVANDVQGCTACAVTGTGTGTYDDAANVVNFDLSTTAHIDFGPANGGPMDGELLAAVTMDLNVPSANQTALSCNPLDPVAAVAICGSYTNVPGNTTSYGDVYDGAFSPAAFTLVSGSNTVYTANAEMFRTFTITVGDEVSAVPDPAAAWLFGSALIGLVGVGRKRR